MRAVNARWLILWGQVFAGGRGWAFAGCAVVAAVLGFVIVPPAVSEKLIVGWGYYYIGAVFAAFVFYGWRVARSRREVWRGWLRSPGGVGWVLVGAVGFAVWSDDFKHKILFDEYVLQGTAWHMHATKEIGTPMRAYDVEGTWLAIDTFLDKRPYFFTFLLSLVHDMMGFRVENIFGLNVVLAAVCLGLTYWLVHALTGRKGPALVAVALLVTLPLFGQNATGAGMEMHNLTMIAVVMACGVLYLRGPDADRLALLVLGAVLLAQSRYESVLFVFPVAVLIVLGWWRRGVVMLPWAAVVAPLLLVPYAWHDRIVNSKQFLWQLRAGETSRFALSYLQVNLEGAWNFFFSVAPIQPNSLWLTLLGGTGVGWAGWRWWRRRVVGVPLGQEVAAPWVVVAWGGATIGANVGLLMFYYWSRFDEPVAARFALPACWWLAILAGAFVHALNERGLPGLKVALLGLVVWGMVWAGPAYARRLYTAQNMVMRELEWELEWIKARAGSVLLITSNSTMPFILNRVPTVNLPSIRRNPEQLAWHWRRGTFREVLVIQVLRPTSAAGDLGVDSDEVLPVTFHLETLAQKRFGARWIRISRLVELASNANAGQLSQE